MKIARIDSEIKRTLSYMISYEIDDERISGKMISVTGVETTKDLKYAKVYISTLNNDEQKTVIEALMSMKNNLRNELFRKLRVRAVPELTFAPDTSAEYGFKIEKVLKELKEKEKDSE